jgi:hypothetical protein
MSRQSAQTLSPPVRATRRTVFPSGPLPLNPGDRLSRAEFERRYQAHPEIPKAELIEGCSLHGVASAF